MPGSIQLVGPPFSEARIYQAAAAYEVEAGYTERSPDL